MSTFKLLTFVTSLLVSAGCGESRSAVVKTSGQIFIDGEPLTFKGNGTIRVVPYDGDYATGRINPEDGTFTLTTFKEGDGVVPGSHPVCVVVNTFGPGGNVLNLVPESYADPTKTGLMVTIIEPTDSLRIELQSKLPAAPSSADSLKRDASGF
ncbi:hypothetical protein GC197_06915 [bacterium]|nr:hypothetical protein [bacterium]